MRECRPCSRRGSTDDEYCTQCGKALTDLTVEDDQPRRKSPVSRRYAAGCLVVFGVFVVIILLVAVFDTSSERSEVPATPTRTAEQQSLWRERLTHLRNLDAVGDERVRVMEDSVISPQELSHVCSTLPQRFDQMRAAEDYVRRFRASEPDTVSFDISRLERFVEPAMGILDSFRETCVRAGLLP